MTTKAVRLRPAAQQDVDDAVAHYVGEGGEPLASAFIDTMETTFRRIAQHPKAGSPRYAIDLDLPDVRSWRLRRLPYLVFYVELEAEVDVWRVLHAQRDIPAWLKPLD